MKLNNEYLSCFRVIIYVMKIFGVFPFILLHRGTKTSLLLCKALTLLSLLLYALLLPIQVAGMYNITRLIVANFNFIFFVGNIPGASFKLILILLPFVTWNKNANLYAYWTNWIHFQNEMENLTGRPFSSSVKNKINWITGSSLLGTTIASFLIRYRSRLDLSLSALASTFYLTILLITIALYWFINNLYIRTVAKQILRLIQKSIRDNNASKLDHLIDLWLMLCNLNEQFNKSHSILFLLYLSCSVINTVATAYCFLVLLFTASDRTISISYLYVNILCFCCILAFCESANSLFIHITNQMKEALLSEKIIKRKPRLIRTIFLFLQTIETRKPRVTMNGYLYLNRSTITTIFAAVINFLVVLKQFSVM